MKIGFRTNDRSWFMDLSTSEMSALAASLGMAFTPLLTKTGQIDWMKAQRICQIWIQNLAAVSSEERKPLRRIKHWLLRDKPTSLQLLSEIMKRTAVDVKNECGILNVEPV